MVFKDPNINTPAVHLRPGTGTDTLGNPTTSGTDTVIANVRAGVFPPSTRHDPYRSIGGGEMNLGRWSVPVIGASSILPGDAIYVATGTYPGKYRVQLVLKAPRDPVTLAQCIRETTS